MVRIAADHPMLTPPPVKQPSTPHKLGVTELVVGFVMALIAMLVFAVLADQIYNQEAFFLDTVARRRSMPGSGSGSSRSRTATRCPRGGPAGPPLEQKPPKDPARSGRPDQPEAPGRSRREPVGANAATELPSTRPDERRGLSRICKSGSAGRWTRAQPVAPSCDDHPLPALRFPAAPAGPDPDVPLARPGGPALAETRSGPAARDPPALTAGHRRNRRAVRVVSGTGPPRSRAAARRR